MKRIKLIYVLLLAMALPLLIACTNDDFNNSDPTNQKGEKITVRFRVSQAGTNTMRAGDWVDNVAEDDEMMNIWTVIAVNATNDKVAGIWSCKPTTGKEQEVDGIEEIFEAELDKDAKYRFYSFANMGAAYLKEKLGFTSDIIPVPTGANIEAKTDNLDNIILTEETVNAVVVGINGNGFDPTASNNVFGATGIPMSNVQTFENLQDGSLKDLIVVRMLAKIELWLYNGKGGESDEENLIQVNSITLTDITKNVDGNNADGNLKLLPKYKEEYSDWADKMDPGKLEPNRAETAAIVDLTISSSGATANDKPMVSEGGTKSGNHWTVKAVDNKYVNGTGKGEDKPIKIVFYVNESATPTNDFEHFFLEMDIKSDMQEDGKPKRLRYTMIDDKRNATGEITESWNYIARNDYRIIPIVLDDYEFKIIPYDFPAIGVLPASVKEEDGVYTINFHDYGHFHLLPQVTKYSDGTLVPYGSGDVHWNLGDANQSTASQLLSGDLTTNGVWGSWTDATKETRYVNAAADYDGYNGIPFYKLGYNPITIEDGDEEGGEPVWYVNDSPEWVETPSQPFIFGFIADPNPDNASDYVPTDRKVYHEFTINLHKKGSAPRPMTYRLYMILDTSQMLYRNNGAAPVRHTHRH